MRKSLLAGLDLPEWPQPKAASVPQPKPAETTAAPIAPARLETQPLATTRPTETPARSSWAEPAPVAEPATPAKRKAGRPRIHAACPLTGREKAARYRQKHKALAAKAMTGGVDAVSLSHKDLCLAVARMLNRREDLELRQTGYPLVKELQRRLKSL